MNKVFIFIISLVLLVSCGQKKEKYDPFSIKMPVTKKEKSKTDFEVDFKVTESNVKTIHVKLNDANGYDAIFDTGCSSMLISSLEFAELIKSGTITRNDSLGESISTIADGSVIIHPIYKIRSITVTDTKGVPHIVRDVKATVVDNIEAKILIGNAVIDNWARTSYVVDLNKNVIRFQ